MMKKPRLMFALLRPGYGRLDAGFGVVRIEKNEESARLWAIFGDKVIPVIVREATAEEVAPETAA